MNFQDKLKRNALHWACKFNQAEMAQVLLRLGVNPDAKDFEGKKPLDIARELEFYDLVS